MKINWKLRLQNKTTLLALIGAVAALVYQALGFYDGAVDGFAGRQTSRARGE